MDEIVTVGLQVTCCSHPAKIAAYKNNPPPLAFESATFCTIFGQECTSRRYIITPYHSLPLTAVKSSNMLYPAQTLLILIITSLTLGIDAFPVPSKSNFSVLPFYRH